MKLDFLNNYRPTVTVMIQSETAANAINTIRNAVYEGADAFGLQICRLAPEERKYLKEIYSSSAGRPFTLQITDTGIMRACLMKNVCMGSLRDLSSAERSGISWVIHSAKRPMSLRKIRLL